MERVSSGCKPPFLEAMLASEGQRCPHCGSQHTERQQIFQRDNKTQQVRLCNACGRRYFFAKMIS